MEKTQTNSTYKNVHWYNNFSNTSHFPNKSMSKYQEWSNIQNKLFHTLSATNQAVKIYDPVSNEFILPKLEFGQAIKLKCWRRGQLLRHTPSSNLSVMNTEKKS